jgi:hypothetical protein
MRCCAALVGAVAVDAAPMHLSDPRDAQLLCESATHAAPPGWAGLSIETGAGEETHRWDFPVMPACGRGRRFEHGGPGATSDDSV